MSQLLKKAQGYFENGEINQAMDILTIIKSSKKSIQGTDLLRAKCFLQMGEGNYSTARESIKEELRFHPTNNEANLLFKKLFSEIDLSTYSESHDFLEIAEKLSFYTMMPMKHLFNLFQITKELLLKNVPGNFVECGVAAGGSSALLGALIKKYDSKNRICYSFDTFSGMPSPTNEDRVNGKDAEGTWWGQGTCAAPLQSLIDACNEVDSLPYVIPIQGLFQDTLATTRTKIGKIALLHIDCDWYESTKCVLENFFPLLNSGSKIIIDDFDYWDGVKRAYEQYSKKTSIDYHIEKLTETTALIEIP
jgi:hypothetical protein